MRLMSLAPLTAALIINALAPGAAAASGADRSGLPPLDATTTLLVVAPHPDDETLCCGGVIQRVVRAGGRASIVWITSGDGSRLAFLLLEHTPFPSPAQARALGARRMAEAREASARLGVPESGQLFLGYPDGGVQQLLGGYRQQSYSSRFTAADAVPYSEALFPAHLYTGASLARDFDAVLERVHPTLILAPSLLDTHPDHRAVGTLTLAALAQRSDAPQVRYWIVHGAAGWPSPRELMPGVPLTAAPCSDGAMSTVFTLEPAEEDGKLHALRAHVTQLQVMAPFLLAFVRTTEEFSAAPQ
jgi:LmbE family N-acetylglucosaminyl deacetylase